MDLVNTISFLLASENYAIESEFVKEVYPLKDFTQIPGLPDFFTGVINYRGQILAVIDLKKFFNLPVKGLGELNKVIILHNRNFEFGILADQVLGTRMVPSGDIRPVPLAVTGIGEEYLKGVTGENLIVLNAVRLLEDERLKVG